MRNLPSGEKVIAESDVWDLIGENSLFKKFLEYALTRFIHQNSNRYYEIIPDDIEDTFSERLYVIRIANENVILLSFTGDNW